MDSGDGGTTTKKKLAINKSEAGRRLVEYFVVVSSVPRKLDDKDEPSKMDNEWKIISSFDQDEDYFAKSEYSFKPVITARYPIYDYPDNPLHENVTFFCHPSGAIRLSKECSMPKVHYFVATGGHGKQVYGTCLTLWEPCTLKSCSSNSNDNNYDGLHNEEKEEEKEREVFLPKCLVLLSNYPYLMAFREYLTQLNRLSKLGEMTLPIERYIANFCSEIPAPPPGSFEVQTTILDSVIRIWSPPHNQPIAWVSLPFSHLFECLDVDNVVLVWQCLVLERQVLLTSTQLSILTTCAEILLSLLFPMRWSHAYIPVLPHFLIPILSAPMPFLCGISKANLADALYDLSRECVLVDLDKNLVTMGPDTAPLPKLPPMQHATLRHLLEENVGMVFREARCLTKSDDYSESGAHLPSHKKVMAEAMWDSKLCLFDEAFHLLFTPEESRKNILNGNDSSGLDLSDREVDPHLQRMQQTPQRKQSNWDAVQEAFMSTFVYLLRNYRKFLVFPSKDNEGSYGGAGFRSKEFLESQRFDMREFLEQLIHSQMYDNFITKRLYGSGEADVAFFDMAVDRFLKSAGLLANVDLSGRLLAVSGVAARSVDRRASSTKPSMTNNSVANPAPIKAPRNAKQNQEEPLLQSARVHRKLKTIVPPEPSGEGLPHGAATAASVDVAEDDHSVDDVSVGSASTGASNKNSKQGSPSRRNLYKSVQDKAALILEKQNIRYTYSSFPCELDPQLFGTPRPLPSAVIAEFDRQRKDAAQFRRKKSHMKKQTRNSITNTPHIQRAHAMTDPEVPESPEVATFTVFFMAFTAMVGKELMEISYDPAEPDKTILSTYVPMSKTDPPTATSTAANSTTTDSDYGDSDFDDEEEQVSAEEKMQVAEMKSSRPNMSAMFGDEEDDDDDNSPYAALAELPQSSPANPQETAAPEEDADASFKDPTPSSSPVKEPSVDETAKSSQDEEETTTTQHQEPRRRFTECLSALQIEEAKAKGRAQLGLAFEMLTMMKKRALKADPEAYQCLIDACGRVGDTKRATELLAKMHEDGIVADGTVYACLVSAFSAEAAWKQASGTQQEELPAWANSTSIEMDWNKLQKRSLLERLRGRLDDDEDDDDGEGEQDNTTTYQKFRNIFRTKTMRQQRRMSNQQSKMEEHRMEFFVTEGVERQIRLGENLLEIVYPDISVDTDNETCPRCNFLLSDDDVVAGWTPGDSNDYTTSCPNCTQRFVPHFCVQSTSPTFNGSRGPSSPLMCERLSPWVLQKEIRTVMSDRGGIENLQSLEWREGEYKNAVLWWNLVLSCMRYRFPFSYLLQGSFEQNLIAPMPEDEA